MTARLIATRADLQHRFTDKGTIEEIWRHRATLLDGIAYRCDCLAGSSELSQPAGCLDKSAKRSSCSRNQGALWLPVAGAPAPAEQQ